MRPIHGFNATLPMTARATTVMLIILDLGCGPSSSTVVAPDGSSSSPTSVPGDDRAVSSASTRLVVSFSSPGSGINHAAVSTLRRLVEAKGGAELLGLRVDYWGMEGERDYRFGLPGMSAAERDAFVADVRAALEGMSSVSIEDMTIETDP